MEPMNYTCENKTEKKVIVLSYLTSLSLIIVFFLLGYQIRGETIITDSLTGYTAYDIFIHNQFISLISFFGVFLLGIPNLFIIIMNFFELGNIFGAYQETYSLIGAFQKIASYGIFEIPSIVISNSVGYLLIYALYHRVVSQKKINIKYYSKYIIKMLVLTFLLNIIAAYFEAFYLNK
ncbi:MAG: stage II sporulation protein M [Carnobacterium inhibens]|uniref:stage II sporulation protein M n=1 Tax=Carnobacterium inhibens TaxID=147709 RepID=UPI003315BE26